MLSHKQMTSLAAEPDVLCECKINDERIFTEWMCVVISDLMAEFDGVDKTSPNCVVIGDAADKFSYQNLNEAFRVLVGLENPVLFSLGQGWDTWCHCLMFDSSDWTNASCVVLSDYLMIIWCFLCDLISSDATIRRLMDWSWMWGFLWRRWRWIGHVCFM